MLRKMTGAYTRFENGGVIFPEFAITRQSWFCIPNQPSFLGEGGHAHKFISTFATYIQ